MAFHCILAATTTMQLASCRLAWWSFLGTNPRWPSVLCLVTRSTTRKQSQEDNQLFYVEQVFEWTKQCFLSERKRLSILVVATNNYYCNNS